MTVGCLLLLIAVPCARGDEIKAKGPASQGPGALSEVDDYEQWKQALGTDSGTDPSTFLVPEGFQIELLRSAAKDEGSWISLAFDPQGRVTIAREDQGLLRFTLAGDGKSAGQVETIDDTLKECRGLLYAHGALYANANLSKGLYRLRDTDGDGRFDETKLLYASEGKTGHGRNDLALGPDGMIYSMHGDSVKLPDNADDLLSPFREHRRGAKSSEGHLVRLDRDGNSVQLVASGLRNPYGIDFNPDGELFTYDADAEFDMGSAWYRPTRVVHLVPGGDYGWRGVTGKWPPYFHDHPDNAPPAVDIGRGSPTAVKFGTTSNFPAPYRQALFLLDWAYGRIVAVHLVPHGASYTGRFETFVKGRPFNVTDLDFGPDGAMYVVTGGRKTQSGLYRIRYVGPASGDTAPAVDGEVVQRAAEARRLRRRLETLSAANSASTLDEAWPHLGSADASIRYAARIAVERQPLANWQARALAESQPAAALTALMALARSADNPTRERGRSAGDGEGKGAGEGKGDASSLADASGCQEMREAIIARLNQLAFGDFSVEQKLAACYIYGLCLAPLDCMSAETIAATTRQLDGHFPVRSTVVVNASGAVKQGSDPVGERKFFDENHQPERVRPLFQPDTSIAADEASALNRALARLLTVLGAPRIVPRILQLVDTAGPQAEQMHYLFLLRHVKQGWTHDDRQTYVHLLRQLDQFQGGEGMPTFVRQIRADVLASLDETARAEFETPLAANTDQPVEPQAASPVRPFVREWKLDELVGSLGEVGAGRDLARGRAMFSAALCVRCHRFGNEGHALGPDLTAVARRFSRRDMLEAVLDPSKVVAEQYRTVQIETTDGRVHSGRIVLAGDFRLPILRLSTNPLEPWQSIDIPKNTIERHTTSPVSLMPVGLVNTLTKEEILDLLAHLEEGGGGDRGW